METGKSLTLSELHGKTEKPSHVLVAKCLIQLGSALNREVSIDQIAMYCRALEDIGELQLKFAFETALRALGEFMPSIAQIRSYAEEWRPPENFFGRQFRSVSDIDPARCPSGWSPEDVFRAHLTQERLRDGARRPLYGSDSISLQDLRNAAKTSGVTKQEIQGWLDDGKITQGEYIARLESDPQWRESARRFGGKVSTSDDLAGLRNGKSDIPEDPEERKSWAKQRGEKWL